MRQLSASIVMLALFALGCGNGGRTVMLMVRQGMLVRGIILLVLAPALAACGSASSSALLAPSPVAQPAPQPVPIQLMVFTDLASGFSTSDVHDAQEQILRFNSAGEIIWVADGSRFPGYGNMIGRNSPWEVLFGTRDGERRAYLTFNMNYYHYGPPAIVVDLDVVGGQLVTTDTKPPVPLPGT